LPWWGLPAWAGTVLAGLLSGVVGSFLGRVTVLIPRGCYCADCGYNLRGVHSGRCPECGLAFTVSTPEPTADDEAS